MGQVIVPPKGELPKIADVVIAGGGIVGVSTAFFLSRASLMTVVVEKREALGSLTTASSTECFRAQFESAENIALLKIAISARNPKGRLSLSRTRNRPSPERK